MSLYGVTSVLDRFKKLPQPGMVNPAKLDTPPNPSLLLNPLTAGTALGMKMLEQFNTLPTQEPLIRGGAGALRPVTEIPTPAVGTRGAPPAPAAPIPGAIQLDIPNPDKPIQLDIPNPNPQPRGMAIEPPMTDAGLLGGIAKGLVGGVSDTAKDIYGNLRQVPREHALPATSGLLKYIGKPEDERIETAIAPTPGVPQPSGRGLAIGALPFAAALDTFVMTERFAVDAVFGLLGEDPQLTAGERGKRALMEERGLGTRWIKSFAKKVQPDVDKAVANGMSAEEIKRRLILPQVFAGTMGDLISVDVWARAIGAPGRAIRGLIKMKQIGKSKAAAAEFAKLAEQDALKGVAGDPSKQLPFLDQGKGPRIVKDAKGKPIQVEAPGDPGPIVGKGFVGGEGGFKRKIEGPQIEQIIEKPGRAAPVEGRRIPGEIALDESGRRIQVPGENILEVSAAQPKALSKEVRMAQAADAARAAEAQAVGDLNRAKIAGEKAFPPQKQKQLPLAEKKTPFEQGLGQQRDVVSTQRGEKPAAGAPEVKIAAEGPKAGAGFVVDEVNAFIKRPSKEMYDKWMAAVKNPDVIRKRLMDAARNESMEAKIRLNRILRNFEQGQGKLQALPAPEAGVKGVLPVEKEIISGKGFIVGGKEGPGKGSKKVVETGNIIERAAEQKPMSARQIALDEARAAERSARKKEAARIRKNEKARAKRQLEAEKEKVVEEVGGQNEARVKAAEEAKKKPKSINEILTESLAKMTEKKGVIKIKDVNTKFQEFPGGPSSEETVKGMVEHLKGGGELPPIVISKNNFLQNGRHRLEAYKRVGREDIPFVYETEAMRKGTGKKVVKVTKGEVKIDYTEGVTGATSAKDYAKKLSAIDKAKEKATLKALRKAKKRTLKDQLKDIGDLGKPGKDLQSGGLKFSPEAKRAAARLAVDAKEAGMTLVAYLRKNFPKLSKQRVSTILATSRDLEELAKANLMKSARRFKKEDIFVRRKIDSKFFKEGRKTIKGHVAEKLEKEFPGITSIDKKIAKLEAEIRVNEFAKEAAISRGEKQLADQLKQEVRMAKVQLNSLKEGKATPRRITDLKRSMDEMKGEMSDLEASIGSSHHAGNDALTKKLKEAMEIMESDFKVAESTMKLFEGAKDVRTITTRRGFLAHEALMDDLPFEAVVKKRLKIYDNQYRKGNLTAKEYRAIIDEFNEISVDAAQLRNIYKSAQQRTIKEQLKDLGDILTPSKSLQSGGLKRSDKSRNAMNRLIRDAERAEKDIETYLKTTLGVRSKSVLKTVSKYVKSLERKALVQAEHVRNTAAKASRIEFRELKFTPAEKSANKHVLKQLKKDGFIQSRDPGLPSIITPEGKYIDALDTGHDPIITSIQKALNLNRNKLPVGYARKESSVNFEISSADDLVALRNVSRDIERRLAIRAARGKPPGDQRIFLDTGRGNENFIEEYGAFTEKAFVARESLYDILNKEISSIKAAERIHPMAEASRTFKNQIDDIRSILKGPKGIMSFPGGEFSPEQISAAKRLAADAKRAKKDFARYLKEDVGITDEKRVKDIISASSKTLEKAAAKVVPTMDAPTASGKKVKIKKPKKMMEYEKEAMNVSDVDIVLAEKVVGKDGKVTWKGGTKIGNYELGRDVARGRITMENAKLFVKGTYIDPTMARRFKRVPDVAVDAAATDAAMLDVVNQWLALAPEKRFAISGVKLDVGLKIMDGPGSAIDRLTEATQALHDHLMLKNAFGGAFRQMQRPRNAPAFIANLRKLMDDAGLTPKARADIEALIGRLQKNEKLVSWFDIIHEVGINNMLFGTVTAKRNLFGNAIGVGMQPGNKFWQAMVSYLPGARNTAHMQEFPATIAGMFKAVPSAFREGIKFAAFGDAENILAFLTWRMKQIRAKPGPATKADIAKIQKIRKSIIKALGQARIGTRLSEVRPTGGQSFSAKAKFGSKFVSKHPKFSAAFDIMGAVSNIASRSLAGVDKFFQTISAGGTKAARKVALAMERDPKNWRKIARVVQLNKKEMAGAIDDSLEYVYRDAIAKDPVFGDILTRAEKFIGEARFAGIPLGKAIFAFMKTSTKLLRFAVTHGPLGVIEQLAATVIEKGPTGAPQLIFKTLKSGKKSKVPSLRGIDAKEMGKAINGSVVLLSAWAYLKKHNGRLVGVAKKKGERDLTRMQDIEEMRIEWLDKDGNVTSTVPVNNLSPATPAAAAIASLESYHRRMSKQRETGETKGDVSASESNAFFKAILQQSVYNNVNEINKATVQLFDEKVPVDEFGNSDKGSVMDAFGNYFKRLIGGRAIPAEFREIKRTGKFLGMDVAEEDRTIFDTKTIGQEIRSAIPDFKGFDPKKPSTYLFGPAAAAQKAFPNVLTDKDIPKRYDFTGDVAQRSRRVSLEEILKGGRAPSSDPVIAELQRLKLYPAQAPRDKTIFTIKTRLTEEERRTFTKRMKPAMMNGLQNAMSTPEYKTLSDFAKAKKLINVMSLLRTVSGIGSFVEAGIRQGKTKEGRAQLQHDTFKGRSPFPPKE